jgi:hypothetical protein
MKKERRIVNNRVFLLGLDELYREAMKRHERGELLACAKDTTKALSVAPADVPIEGYYTEHQQLTEYFRLMRALQNVPSSRAIEVAETSSFRRLKQVTESPIFGPPANGPYLLSMGKDALTVALEKTFPHWTVPNLTQAAYHCAAGSTDFSLVALAALARDAVVLAALRESVVLYVAAAAGCAMPQEPEYVWQVDEMVEQRAAQFVETFNELFGESVPRPGPENAEVFWLASSESDIVGRCVRLGFDDSVTPVRHYHWAIDFDEQYNEIVKEFWDTQIWTTAMYQEQQEAKWRR